MGFSHVICLEHAVEVFNFLLNIFFVQCRHRRPSLLHKVLLYRASFGLKHAVKVVFILILILHLLLDNCLQLFLTLFSLKFDSFQSKRIFEGDIFLIISRNGGIALE